MQATLVPPIILPDYHYQIIQTVVEIAQAMHNPNALRPINSKTLDNWSSNSRILLYESGNLKPEYNGLRSSLHKP